MGRIFRTGLFLAACQSACLCTSLPAYAGFEFLAPPAAPAQGFYDAASQAQDAALAGGDMGGMNAPQDDAMPAVPTAEVTAIPLTPGPNEAIDTRGLLAATSRGMPVSLSPEQAAPAPRPAAISAASGNGGLYIDPYPLKNKNPGSSEADLMGAMAGMPSASTGGNGAMMPMPGGEGPPIYPTGRVSSYTSEAVAPAPAPKVSRSMPRGPDEVADNAGRYVAAQPPAQMAQGQAEQYGEAVGFGRDLPLALAMSQIVPPEYTYSFGKNVNKGATVSWQGGKPWNVVLDEMLAPSGMKAVVNGADVKIVKT